MYRQLDLCCGMKGFSQAMIEDDNWEVVTLDIEEKFNPTICKDIVKIDVTDLPYHSYNLITGAPPCNIWGPGSYNNYWSKVGDKFIIKKEVKKDKEKWKMVIHMVKVAKKCFDLSRKLDVDFIFIENPKNGIFSNVMKQIGVIGDFEIESVTQCQYGKDYRKNTHLIGRFPLSMQFKSCKAGDYCHISGKRGSRTGVQNPNKTSEEIAKIPYNLSKSIKEAVENPDILTLKDFEEENQKDCDINELFKKW